MCVLIFKKLDQMEVVVEADFIYMNILLRYM